MCKFNYEKTIWNGSLQRGVEMEVPMVHKQSHPRNLVNGGWQEDRSAKIITFLMKNCKHRDNLSLLTS